MTKKQKDKLTAGELAMKYLGDNPLVWAAIGDIGTYKTIGDAKVASINSNSTIQKQNNKGRTQNKEVKREDLEASAITVINKFDGSVYAKTHIPLKYLLFRTPSQLSAMTPDDLINFCNSIVTNIPTPIPITLASSGLIAADVTLITTNVAGFNPVKADPKAAIAQRKAATQTMPGNIKNLTEVIVDISKLMINLISNNTFYNGWFSTIAVYKTGIHYTRKYGLLPVSATFAWTKVIANSAIKNTSLVGNIRVGGGKKISEVTEWIILVPGEEYLNFFGPDIIIDNLFTTGITKYELHSKSQKGKRLI